MPRNTMPQPNVIRLMLFLSLGFLIVSTVLLAIVSLWFLPLVAMAALFVVFSIDLWSDPDMRW